MSRRNEVLIDNMSFTLRSIGRLPSCRLRFLDDRSFLLSTGIDAGSENWAFVPTPLLQSETVRLVPTFFRETRLPFIWPLLPNALPAYGRALEEAGFPAQGTLLAMARNVPPSPVPVKPEEPLCAEITTPEQVALWAETAWRGFDSPSPAPSAFVRLAQGFAAPPPNGPKSFVPVLASLNDRPVGTFLLSLTENAAGVYYFATLPEMRRSGVGSAMMRAIFRFAALKSASFLTLQATPAGTPFYLSQGFEKLFEIPIHSSGSEIF